ncbi:MAG: NUDIX hydrolase [Arthrobacter sp.]|jgi:8-oxo-dGTP pyrophosphatase MutT (NUDIX family)|nr:NUDIX hydrolase [Arthrobacter sp.]
MSTPPVVKDAATVLLLRRASGGAPGVEVFMQVRASSMAFAAGAAVFPGGSVDPSDRHGTAEWGLPALGGYEAFINAGAEELALAGGLVAAAIRESYEECGVLLAEGPPARLAQRSGWVTDEDRAALSEHSTSIAEVLQRRGLLPDLASLTLVDRWITPEGEPRRYDTRFFAAALPAGQEADDETTETSRSFWVRPAEALEQFSRGELALMPPTWAQLDRLTRAATLKEALAPATTDVTVPVLEHTEGTVVAHFWGTEAYRKAGRPQHS